MATSTGNFLFRIGRNPLLAVLVVSLLFSLLGFAANSYFVGEYARQDETIILHTDRLGLLSQQIAKLIAQASSEGTQQALKQAVSEFDEHFAALEASSRSGGIGAPSPEVFAGLEEISLAWDATKLDIETIASRQTALQSLNGATTDLAESVAAIEQEYSKVVAAMLRASAPVAQVVLAQRQSLVIERIRSGADQLARSGSNEELIANIAQDRRNFEEVQKGLAEGSRAPVLPPVADAAAQKSLARIDEHYAAVSARLDEIVSLAVEVAKVNDSSSKVLSGSTTLLGQITDLRDAYRNHAGSRLMTPLSGLVLGFLVIVIVLVISVIIYRESSASLAETAQQNENNQKAILQLLDELADLADGDLRVQASVTESFTGAIADSINFSIDQMRGLVSQINATSTRVSSAAAETRQSVTELEKASQQQAAEIKDVSRSVDEMAISIDRVSYNAAESTAVAERSVEIANNGAQVVQNTIGGMEKIRGQIQETAKRIKRLGESSQEIGDIVNLINDIADQTNILSLNAAIQASMAGDAGRGFAVVADEVQRLAERSGAAAKQIAALVKTIQSDTNEAVISMEQTTAEVVQGARLAHDAGEALDEIESVSKSLAELIENISDAARQQAASAGKISNTMKSIQEITSQTTQGTQQTAVAVGNFARMTDDLRQSVSGFKLPA